MKIIGCDSDSEWRRNHQSVSDTFLANNSEKIAAPLGLV